MIKLFTGTRKIFFTAIVGASLTSCHIFFLSKSFYFGIIFSAFTLNMVASQNSKWIAIGGFKDRLYYSIGGTIGALIGLYVSSMIKG